MITSPAPCPSCEHPLALHVHPNGDGATCLTDGCDCRHEASRARPTAAPADDRAVRAQDRRRVELERQAYEAGLAGTPWDPDVWPDLPGLAEAHAAGVAQRRHDRRPDRIALDLLRRHAPSSSHRRRMVRQARRRPWLAGVLAVLAVVVLAVVAAAAGAALALWATGRLVAGLAGSVRSMSAAWGHPDT